MDSKRFMGARPKPDEGIAGLSGFRIMMVAHSRIMLGNFGWTAATLILPLPLIRSRRRQRSGIGFVVEVCFNNFSPFLYFGSPFGYL